MTVDLSARLAGKRVLVTGGGSGLGKGACQRITAEGGATVAFLLSDDAGYITGAAIPLDGGYLST